VPSWIRRFSLAITVVFIPCAFLPFLSWAPALLWLLVVGLGLLAVPAAREAPGSAVRGRAPAHVEAEDSSQER